MIELPTITRREINIKIKRKHELSYRKSTKREWWLPNHRIIDRAFVEYYHLS